MRAPLLAALVAVALAAPSLSACDSADGGPDLQPEPVRLLPLAVGTRWAFDHQFTDGAGGTPVVRVDTLAVTRDTVVDGERWYFLDLVTHPVNFSRLGDAFFANRADGLYVLTRYPDGTLRPRAFFRTDVEVGETYVPPQLPGDVTYEWTMTLLAAGELHPGPSGPSPAYHYRLVVTAVSGRGMTHVGRQEWDHIFSPTQGPLLMQNGSLSLMQDGQFTEGMRLEWRAR